MNEIEKAQQEITEARDKLASAEARLSRPLLTKGKAMSLLTKEQLQIVNGIKAMIADYDYKTDQIRGLFDLVSIIDDLQARAQPENAKPCKNPPDKVYRLLVPGGDLWQEGDEVWSDREGWMHYLDYYGGVLYYNRKTMHGEIMRHVSSPVRRAESRAPRQYTEQELREWFENRPLVQDEIDALLHEVVPGENEAWYSVLKFAAHVGALKAEP